MNSISIKKILYQISNGCFLVLDYHVWFLGNDLSLWPTSLYHHQPSPTLATQPPSPSLMIGLIITCPHHCLPSSLLALIIACPHHCLPSSLPTTLIIACPHHCLPSSLPALIIANPHHCLPSSISTLNHCLPSSLPALIIAYPHHCLLSSLPTLNHYLPSSLPTLIIAYPQSLPALLNTCPHHCLPSSLPALIIAPINNLILLINLIVVVITILHYSPYFLQSFIPHPFPLLAFPSYDYQASFHANPFPCFLPHFPFHLVFIMDTCMILLFWIHKIGL